MPTKVSNHATLYNHTAFNDLLQDRDPYVQPRIATIEAHLGKELHHGDVVLFDDDRAKHAFIVLVDMDGHKRFIKNPDNAGSGYLTIPIEITRQLPDATRYLARVIHDLGYLLMDIELSWQDPIVWKLIPNTSIQDTDLYHYYPYYQSMAITRNKEYNYFELPISSHDIEKAFEKQKSPHTKAKMIQEPQTSVFQRMISVFGKKKTNKKK